MDRAVALAAAVRATTSPNPWVGCVIEDPGGRRFEGATAPPGGPHAEASALAAAGAAAAGSTVWVTLEPCAHQGRTPPCADAMVAAGVRRVFIGVNDPDPNVRGAGIARMRDGGIDVEVLDRTDVAEQLAPYLKHRRTGRPWVVLKLAATLDGRTAAPDGTSQWITGEAARADVHRLRAESDAVIVGAGTVRTDDPSLTVRLVDGADPVRIVLGKAPDDANVRPCREMTGEPGEILDDLGAQGIVQVLVEGGGTVAGEWHRAGLVDRYVLYFAPALFGGDDAHGLFAGPGAETIGDVWRGRVVSVTQLGADVRLELTA